MSIEIIALLAGSISRIISPEYIKEKAIETGTGMLWKRLKNKLEEKNNSIGYGLYNAIENSVKIYAHNSDDDEDIALCCEKLYFEWVENKCLKDESIKKALHMLNANINGGVEVENWKSILDKEIMKNKELREWIDHTYLVESNNKLDCINNKLDEQNRLLKKCITPEKNTYENMQYNKYIDNMSAAFRESVMGEKFGLNKIYTELHGLIKHDMVNKKERVLYVTECIMDWLDKEEYSQNADGNNILLIYGEPGSGKSSVLKKMVDELTKGDKYKTAIILSLNLFNIVFVNSKSALESVEKHIKDKYNWFYEIDTKIDRVLILDGLDEIKYKVYEKSQELLRELEGKEWSFNCKVIVSGRPQVIKNAKDEIDNYMELEILPLYIDGYSMKDYKIEHIYGHELLKEDLRVEYWNKLQKNFEIVQDMPLDNDGFDELSGQPLLLFLIMWTVKYSNIDLKKLKDIAELYDKIFECIYTREYSRKGASNLTYRTEYSEYKKMLYHLGGCAYRNNSRSVSAESIYEYCIMMGDKELCEKWIQLHKEDNPSKLVLLFFLRENYNKDNKSEVYIQDTEVEFIHKTFYEYLSAIEIIRIMYEYVKSDDYDKKLRQIFYIFSQNRLYGRLIYFIMEIIRAQSLVIDEEVITLSKYYNMVNKMIISAYNTDYPVMIGKRNSTEYIYAKNYSELKQITQTYEINISELIRVTTQYMTKGPKNREYKLKLENMRWDNADIRLWNLNECRINNSHMESIIASGATFKYSELVDDILKAATADRADFDNAILENVDFTCASLTVANFTEAIIKFTVFDTTKMEGALFKDSELIRVSFEMVNLTAANFNGAVLKEVDFFGANLTRANLTGVIIKYCQWHVCIMEGAILDDVDISSFDLEDESIIEMLSAADLSNAVWDNVTDEQEKRLFQEKRKHDTKLYEL